MGCLLVVFRAGQKVSGKPSPFEALGLVKYATSAHLGAPSAFFQLYALFQERRLYRKNRMMDKETDKKPIQIPGDKPKTPQAKPADAVHPPMGQTPPTAIPDKEKAENKLIQNEQLNLLNPTWDSLPFITFVIGKLRESDLNDPDQVERQMYESLAESLASIVEIFAESGFPVKTDRKTGMLLIAQPKYQRAIFRFRSKPPASVIEILLAEGFTWSGKHKNWQKEYNIGTPGANNSEKYIGFANRVARQFAFLFTQIRGLLGISAHFKKDKPQ